MQVRLTYILSNLISQESQCYPAWWSKIKSQQGRRGWFAILKNGLSHMLFAKLFTNILSLIFWNKKLFSRKVFTLWRCIEVQTTLAKVISTKPYWIHTTFDKTDSVPPNYIEFHSQSSLVDQQLTRAMTVTMAMTTKNQPAVSCSPT